MIGGWNGKTTGETWFFHTNSEPWQKIRGPDLNKARIYAGCQVYDFQDDKYLVVTGGYKMTSTEFLNVKIRPGLMVNYDFRVNSSMY